MQSRINQVTLGVGVLVLLSGCGRPAAAPASFPAIPPFAPSYQCPPMPRSLHVNSDGVRVTAATADYFRVENQYTVCAGDRQVAAYTTWGCARLNQTNPALDAGLADSSPVPPAEASPVVAAGQQKTFVAQSDIPWTDLPAVYAIQQDAPATVPFRYSGYVRIRVSLWSYVIFSYLHDGAFLEAQLQGIQFIQGAPASMCKSPLAPVLQARCSDEGAPPAWSLAATAHARLLQGI